MSRTVAELDPEQQLKAAHARWQTLRRDERVPARELRDAALAVVVAARLAGRYQEAALVADEAHARFDKLPAAERALIALVDAHTCLSCLDAGMVESAERWLDAAQSLDARAFDDETFAALCRAEGNVQLARRRWQDAIGAFQRGLERTHDDVEKTIALYNMGEANIRLGRFADARALFVRASVDKRRLQDRWGLAYVCWGIGCCALALGELAEATSFASEGLELTRTLLDPKISARLWTLRARCLLKAGDLDGADAAGRDAVRESTRAALPRERADAQLAMAEVHGARGFGRLAHQAADAAIEIASKGQVSEIVEAAQGLKLAFVPRSSPG
jgi:tetratricopeptide (TPR) repeat protein